MGDKKQIANLRVYGRRAVIDTNAAAVIKAIDELKKAFPIRDVDMSKILREVARDRGPRLVIYARQWRGGQSCLIKSLHGSVARRRKNFHSAEKNGIIAHSKGDLSKSVL